MHAPHAAYRMEARNTFGTIQPVLWTLEYIFHYIRFGSQIWGDMGGYEGYGGKQRDTAGYSRIQRDTGAGYSGSMGDTAGYSGIQRDTIKIYTPEHG